MIAYFDCVSGASGDMILGALVDAGLPLEDLQGQVDRLGLPGLCLRARSVQKKGFGATKVDVLTEDSQGHRRYTEIRRIIESSSLSHAVKERSLRVFNRLAEAESHIHRVQIEDVHFHEVGSLDALADIAGAVAGLDLLQVKRIEVSPLPLGTGFVATAHGKQPVPAPATMALVRDVPVRGTGVEAELVTPTGAALLTTLADCFGPMPAMRPMAVGYGAGTWDLEWPNVLRVILGEPAGGLTGGESVERLALLEANIDDMNPEFYEHVAEVLFSRGALDVYWTPVGMKKSRPGILLSVLCRPEAKRRLTETVLRETTTLGVRWAWMDRLTVPRRELTVHTPYGPLKVKASLADGPNPGISPEYEECRRVARERGIPLWRVYQEALLAAREALRRAD
ncbi:MAG: nickel pincer cofactor biosynthesis protein LarC [Nitrospinota bacterium]